MATSSRINQGFQSSLQTWVRFSQGFSSASGTTNPNSDCYLRVRLTIGHLAHTRHDGIPCQTRSKRHGCNTSPTQVRGFRCRPLSAHSLIHQVLEQSVLDLNSLDCGCVLYTTTFLSTSSPCNIIAQVS